MPRTKKTQDIAPVIIKQGPRPAAVIFALIVTAIFVGGVVFFGQQRIVNKNKEELENSQKQIAVLQNQLDQLQNVINSGMQNQEQNGIKYYNEKYKFSLVIPETWKEYSTKERKLSIDTGKFDSIDFYFEENEPIFNIAMIDKDKWEDSQKLDYYKPIKLSENETTIFAFSFHKEAEQSFVESLRSDIESIVSTFQFEEIPQAQISIENCPSDVFSMKNGVTKLNISAFNNQTLTTTVTGCFHTVPDVLKTTSNYVYFGVKPEGVGGYILYGKYVGLYRVNLEDSKIESMFENSEESLVLTDIDISQDATLAVYKIDSYNRDEFIVKNLETMRDSKYKLPVSGANMQFGNFKFSPDASKLAIAIGYGPDKESGAVYILNLSDKKFTSYQTFDSKIPYIDSWKDNETLNFLSTSRSRDGEENK